MLDLNNLSELCFKISEIEEIVENMKICLT
jgi:hypothetical protein